MIKRYIKKCKFYKQMLVTDAGMPWLKDKVLSNGPDYIWWVVLEESDNGLALLYTCHEYKKARICLQTISRDPFPFRANLVKRFPYIYEYVGSQYTIMKYMAIL